MSPAARALSEHAVTVFRVKFIAQPGTAGTPAGPAAVLDFLSRAGPLILVLIMLVGEAPSTVIQWQALPVRPLRLTRRLATTPPSHYDRHTSRPVPPVRRPGGELRSTTAARPARAAVGTARYWHRGHQATAAAE